MITILKSNSECVYVRTLVYQTIFYFARYYRCVTLNFSLVMITFFVSTIFIVTRFFRDYIK